jgi:hypothetical protein
LLLRRRPSPSNQEAQPLPRACNQQPLLYHRPPAKASRFRIGSRLQCQAVAPERQLAHSTETVGYCPQSGLCLVGRTCLDHPPSEEIAPKCDLPHIPSKLPSHTSCCQPPGGLPAASPCYSMRAPTKKLGNKGLPVVHSGPETRICSQRHRLLTLARGWSLPPNARYSWVLLEQFCWVMIVDGASSSA